MPKRFDVRDTREKNWLWLRRELLREHGAELGAYGIAVYTALASYADQQSEAYPSIKSIAEMIGASPNTVRKALHKLKDLGWIAVEGRQDDSGRQTSNRFYLLTCPVKGRASNAPSRREEAPSRDEPPTLHEMRGDPSSDADEVETNEVETQEARGRAREGGQEKPSSHLEENPYPGVDAALLDDLPPHAPSPRQVVEAFEVAGMGETEALKFFHHYAAENFLDRHDRPLNWKHKIALWKLRRPQFSGDGHSGPEPGVDNYEKYGWV